MRDIKFRGKRVDNGEWVYGYFLKWDEKCHIYQDTDDLLQKALEVLPETVGQYTGKTDSKGVGIYEGDIIKGSTARFTPHRYIGDSPHEKEYVGVVEYHGASFVVFYKDHPPFF